MNTYSPLLIRCPVEQLDSFARRNGIKQDKQLNVCFWFVALFHRQPE